MVLGKKSGRPSIKEKLAEEGIAATDEQIEEILLKVKKAGIEKKGLLDRSEFKQIADMVLMGARGKIK